MSPFALFISYLPLSLFSTYTPNLMQPSFGLSVSRLLVVAPLAPHSLHLSALGLAGANPFARTTNRNIVHVSYRIRVGPLTSTLSLCRSLIDQSYLEADSIISMLGCFVQLSYLTNQQSPGHSLTNDSGEKLESYSDTDFLQRLPQVNRGSP